MCISPDAYTAARVYERLTAAGVRPERALAVSKKVARRYAAKRFAHRERLEDSLARARELDRAIIRSGRRVRSSTSTSNEQEGAAHVDGDLLPGSVHDED